MLSVPILMYLFDFNPKEATTAALAVVFLAALSGAIPKARNKQILYRDALVISGLGTATNIGFSLVVDRLPDAFITTGFALVLLFAGASMLKNPKYEPHTRMPISILIVASLVIGSMTGLFGIVIKAVPSNVFPTISGAETLLFFSTTVTPRVPAT